MYKDAMSLIKFFEACNLKVYPDTNGYGTAGWGHLVLPEDDLKIGDTITQQRADQFLINDYMNAEQRVSRALRDKNFIPTFHQQQALISLAFNLKSFETLASYLPDIRLFKDMMLLYYKDATGVPYKGLKIRRIAERLLFEGRDWFEEAKELQRNTFDYVRKREQALFKDIIPETEIPDAREWETRI